MSNPRFCSRILALSVLAVLLAGGPAFAQGDPTAGEPEAPWFYLGPRFGGTWALTNVEGFTHLIQPIYPNSLGYFPVYSQFGLGLTQRFRLPFGGFQVAFQEWALVSGLDQNFALPAFSLLVSVRAPFGLELGLGPQLGVWRERKGVVVHPALVYAVGWNFLFQRIALPVYLIFDPMPTDRVGRGTLLVGLDYGGRLKLPKAPKEKTPFNY